MKLLRSTAYAAMIMVIQPIQIIQSASAQTATVNLRSEVLATYERLKAQQALAPPNSEGNDISQIADRYIKSGTSFSEAERTLRDNGFTVGEMPPRALTGNLAVDRARFHIYATLPLDQSPLFRSSILIIVEPEVDSETISMKAGKVHCIIKLASI
jgi:hypothetical protein